MEGKVVWMVISPQTEKPTVHTHPHLRNTFTHKLPHTFTSAHPHIRTSAHPHIRTSAHAWWTPHADSWMDDRLGYEQECTCREGTRWCRSFRSEREVKAPLCTSPSSSPPSAAPFPEAASFVARLAVCGSAAYLPAVDAP